MGAPLTDFWDHARQALLTFVRYGRRRPGTIQIGYFCRELCHANAARAHRLRRSG